MVSGVIVVSPEVADSDAADPLRCFLISNGLTSIRLGTFCCRLILEAVDEALLGVVVTDVVELAVLPFEDAEEVQESLILSLRSVTDSSLLMHPLRSAGCCSL